MHFKKVKIYKYKKKFNINKFKLFKLYNRAILLKVALLRAIIIKGNLLEYNFISL